MSDGHVVAVEDGWVLDRENAQRASAKAPTQARTIKRAVEIVAHDGGGSVVVHGTNGEIRETREVAAWAEHTTATAAVTAADAATTGAQAATRAARAEAADVADDVERAAHALNPIRVAGRVVGLAVVAPLGAVGQLLAGGGRVARRSARTLTRRS